MTKKAIYELEGADDESEVAALEKKLQAGACIDEMPAPPAMPDSSPPAARNRGKGFGPSPSQGSTSDCDCRIPGGGESLAQQVPPSNSLPPLKKPRGLLKQDFSDYVNREIVIDSNGSPRQAGADCQEGEFIKRFKLAAEKSLYLFAKGVLGRHFLTQELHKPVCEFLQLVPPFRKLVLMPREHCKTAIVSGGLPLHIIIQSAATNIYFPGLEGSECRILLCGETETMAKKNLRVLEEIHTGNKLFRALWPHRVWDRPSSQAKEWSSTALIFPRENEWPDQTIRAVGVGGAITGARPNVLLKDDLVSFKAANSDVVMDEAIEWHKASRALLDTYEVESGLKSLEFIIGTRWAVFDLYSYIIDNDPSVEVIDSSFHQIIRNGKILWPEKHTKESIAQLRREHGSNFYLLYMNNAADPELTDFDLEQVREFKLLEDQIIFEEDDRDAFLEQEIESVEQAVPRTLEKLRGSRLTPGLLREMAHRKEFFRARYG